MRRKFVCVLAVLMGTIILAGTAGADYYAKVTVDNPISAGTVKVALQETSPGNQYVDMDDGTVSLAGTYMPGATIERKVRAVSRGNRPSYMRIVVEGVADERGLTCLPDPELNVGGTALTEDWLVQSEAGKLVYYYRKPVAPGEATAAVIQGFQVMGDGRETDERSAGQQLTVHFTAEAVQRTAAVEAIAAEWDRDASFDENGILTAIAERSLK